MGREGLVSREEAAEILGVKPDWVSHLTRQGLLKTVNPDHQRLGDILYDVEEVCALAEARSRGNSLSQVHQTATQAFAAARLAQRRVEQLEKLLGLNLPELERDREAVLALRQRAEDDLKKHINGARVVNFWADTLFKMCDLYLEAVADCGFDEPHEPYLSLVNKLARAEDLTTYDPADYFAYRRLHAARDRFRYNIFAYYLRTEGKRKVFQRFPTDFQGVHFDIMMRATE